MMCNMRGPPEALAMRYVVGPVTAEIKQYVTRQERPPVQFHPPRDKVIDPDQDCEDHQLETSADHNISDADPDGTESLSFVVELPVLIIRYDVFDQHKEEHHGRSPNDDVRGIALKLVNVFQQNFVSAE